MKHEKIWKYTCFFVALALILYGVHLARIDAVLHGACKKQLYYSRFATYGLYLFCLTAAALLLYALWLWIAEAVKKKQIACTMVLAVVSAQKKYQLLYEKGLFYDLKGLFR